MGNKIRYTKKPNEIIGSTSEGFYDDFTNRSDAELFNSIGDYMKGHTDLEDVKNDPALMNMSDTVKAMVSEYNINRNGNTENERFVKEGFNYINQEDLKTEIRYIKQEINSNNLNYITSEWVKEWHEKKQKIGVADSNAEEISDFVKDAINSIDADAEPAVAVEPAGLEEGLRTKTLKTSFIRYASFAAAAMIGAFLLIRTLLPSSNPENLFDTYFKPYTAISLVTRGGNNAASVFSAAIENYKNAGYLQAEAGFSDLLSKDPSSVSLKYYLGLTELSLKNYDLAINLLSEVVNNSGEFGKEAKWYLGLTYLETGSKQKAAECFEYLASSQGFYSERSEKILRRLK